MAVYKIEAPDGRILTLDGPDGASQEQIIAAAEELYNSQVSNESAPDDASTSIAGLAGAGVRGLAPVTAGAALGAAIGAPLAGVGAIPGAAAGAGAVGLAQLVGDPIVSTINSMFGTEYTLPTDAMEDLLTRIGVAEPKTEAERIVKSAFQGASTAGGLASAGKAITQAATGPVTQAVGSQLAAQTAQQVAGGAGAGLGAQTAQEMGAGPVGQLIGGLAGGVAGAAALGPRAETIFDAAKAATDDTGIKVLASDVAPPKTFFGRTAQTVGERIPVAGTGGVRAAQRSQRVSAVKRLLSEYGADDVAANASDDVMRSLVSKRGSDLNRYSSLKSAVIDSVDDTKIVPVSRTVGAIDDQIARLEALRTDEVSPVVSKLRDWRSAVENQNLKNVEELRKQMGESFKAPELSSVRSIGQRSLSKIYSSLRDDMGEFIQKNGARRDYTKWKVANKRLSELVGELEKGSIKSVLSKGQATPEVIDRMLFSKKPSDVRQLYANLDPAGRSNARTAILAKAAEKSGGIDNLSPTKFSKEVKRLGSSIGVFFKPEEVKRIEGLSRAIDITKRAVEAGANPPTGIQNWYAMMGIGGAGVASALGGGIPGFVGTVTAAGGVGSLARAYESPAIRGFFARLAKTRPGSGEEAASFKRLASALGRYASSRNKELEESK